MIPCAFLLLTLTFLPLALAVERINVTMWNSGFCTGILNWTVFHSDNCVPAEWVSPGLYGKMHCESAPIASTPRDENYVVNTIYWGGETCASAALGADSARCGVCYPMTLNPTGPNLYSRISRCNETIVVNGVPSVLYEYNCTDLDCTHCAVSTWVGLGSCLPMAYSGVGVLSASVTSFTLAEHFISGTLYSDPMCKNISSRFSTMENLCFGASSGTCLL